MYIDDAGRGLKDYGVVESQTHGANLAGGITVSLGPAEYQKDMVLSDLIKDADEKLYTAKSSERNQVVFKQ